MGTAFSTVSVEAQDALIAECVWKEIMSKSVGVLDSIFLRSISLKRAALMFERLSILDAEQLLSSPLLSKEDSAELSANLEWLEEQGVVQLISGLTEFSDIKPYTLNQQESTDLQHYLRHHKALLDSYQQRKSSETDPQKRMQFGFGVLEQSAEYRMRIYSFLLRATQQINATPLITNSLHSLDILNPSVRSKKADVVDIVIKALPIPDESTSWEQIIDFRNDENARIAFLRLKEWINEVARAELPPIELEDKLEYLISEYKQHIKLHQMKTNMSTLETILTTTAEIAGNLVSFKWGQAAKVLIALRHHQLALLEAESQAPGREIAYIVQAQGGFGKPRDQ